MDTTVDAVDAKPGDGICLTAAGECSLRAAVMEANAWAQPEGETIVLQPAASYALSLTGAAEEGAASGDLDLFGPMHVQGSGATIDASATGERVLHVPLGQVDLADVTVTGGHDATGAGILQSSGHLLTLDRVTVSGNVASERGGGVVGAYLLIRSSNIRANTAVLGGGGVVVEADGSLTVETSTFADNVACPTTCPGQSWGGGVYSDSPVTVRTSTFDGNQTPNGSGSAIYVAQTSLALTNSTVTGGTTFDGSVRTWDGVTSTLEHVTISGNDSSNPVASSGFHAGPGSVATIKSSIIGGQTSGIDCGGGFTLVDGGYNVESGSTCGFTHPTDRQGVDPQLSVLATNGGPTQTMKPAVHSPAVDLFPGPAGCGAFFPTDQRGTARPQRSGCDAGAFELTDAEAEKWYTAVAAGEQHTCALVGDGSVRCWGKNQFWQLGNWNTTDSATPVIPFDLLSGATAIAAGGSQSCALMSDGTVRCWGRQYIANGAFLQSEIPVTVPGLTGATAVVVGGGHACALVTGGTVRCWGFNGYGQLGDGSNTDRPTSFLVNPWTPVTVTGITGAVGITAGSLHTCAVLGDGTARCWGRNASGQLGNGTTADANTPITVTGLSGVTAVRAGGQHTCALLSNGSARCWGVNDMGQLGAGDTTSTTTPVDVFGLTNARALAAGAAHTCAVVGDGVGRCWGGNRSGELGVGFVTSEVWTAPAGVAGLTGAISVAAGRYHSCAVLRGGTVRCWGLNDSGQIGSGSWPYIYPAPVTSLTP